MGSDLEFYAICRQDLSPLSPGRGSHWPPARSSFSSFGAGFCTLVQTCTNIVQLFDHSCLRVPTSAALVDASLCGYFTADLA